MEALERADRVRRAWVEAGYNDPGFKANEAEIAMIPSVWRLLRMRFYGRPRRVTYGGLPGYVVPGWNAPSPEHPVGHHPSSVPEAVRRDSGSDLVYWLHVAASLKRRGEAVDDVLRLLAWHGVNLV